MKTLFYCNNGKAYYYASSTFAHFLAKYARENHNDYGNSVNNDNRS